MSCLEVEQLMANNSELSNLLMSAETEVHSNGFDENEEKYDLDDVSRIFFP